MTQDTRRVVAGAGFAGRTSGFQPGGSDSQASDMAVGWRLARGDGEVVAGPGQRPFNRVGRVADIVPGRRRHLR
jgi:hypothetical protein